MDGEWSAFHVQYTHVLYVHTCYTFNTVLDFYDRLDLISDILKVIQPQTVPISLN
jgi:hypothetical protein